jgi:hypothetical protein
MFILAVAPAAARAIADDTPAGFRPSTDRFSEVKSEVVTAERSVALCVQRSVPLTRSLGDGYPAAFVLVLEVCVRMKSLPLAVILVSSPLTLVQCGGDSSSPAPSAPAVVATPTPAPTPVPKPLSVIGPCPIAASDPGLSASCTKPNARLSAEINSAIDRVIAERPELFNFNDVDGGPRILDYDAYMTAVVSAINQQPGLCGRIDPEGEIGIKSSNSFNEQWIVASKAGWNPPVGNWVWRKYVGACAPAVF